MEKVLSYRRQLYENQDKELFLIVFKAIIAGECTAGLAPAESRSFKSSIVDSVTPPGKWTERTVACRTTSQILMIRAALEMKCCQSQWIQVGRNNWLCTFGLI